MGVAVLQEIASRDMKLQNILLEEDVARQRPLLKVTGFGHAKVLLPLHHEAKGVGRFLCGTRHWRFCFLGSACDVFRLRFASGWVAATEAYPVLVLTWDTASRSACCRHCLTAIAARNIGKKV